MPNFSPQWGTKAWGTKAAYNVILPSTIIFLQHKVPPSGNLVGGEIEGEVAVKWGKPRSNSMLLLVGNGSLSQAFSKMISHFYSDAFEKLRSWACIHNPLKNSVNHNIVYHWGCVLLTVWWSARHARNANISHIFYVILYILREILSFYFPHAFPLVGSEQRI